MNKKGFTLTEMLIVVIIISGLMMLIVPNLSDTKNQLDNKSCDAFINLVDSQIQAFYLENNQYPVNLTELYDASFIKSKTCPDGTPIVIENNKAIRVNPVITSNESTN